MTTGYDEWAAARTPSLARVRGRRHRRGGRRGGSRRARPGPAAEHLVAHLARRPRPGGAAPRRALVGPAAARGGRSPCAGGAVGRRDRRGAPMLGGGGPPPAPARPGRARRRAARAGPAVGLPRPGGRACRHRHDPAGRTRGVARAGDAKVAGPLARCAPRARPGHRHGVRRPRVAQPGRASSPTPGSRHPRRGATSPTPGWRSPSRARGAGVRLRSAPPTSRRRATSRRAVPTRRPCSRPTTTRRTSRR